MKRIIIATTNKNKKRELESLLDGLDAEIITLDELGIHIPSIIEDGKTFAQNAIKKALTFSRYTNGLVVGDDSGLMVKALDGKPGVRSARFARAKATDEENNKKLLTLMDKLPGKDRSATFVCVIAIAKNGTLLGTAEGKCDGTIGFLPKGKNGFGYDPLFIPDGYKRTFAEFKENFKNKISHRGKALQKAKSIFQKYL